MYKTAAIISKKNLVHNYNLIREISGNKKVMAVVKADAYGHGAIEVVTALNESVVKPEYLAVAFVDEAIVLREAGIENKILVFDAFDDELIDIYKQYDLIATINSYNQLSNLKRISNDYSLKLHLKFDTGMHRVGINFQRAEEFINAIKEVPNVIIDGIYSHFATSEERDKSFATQQLNRFYDIIELFKKHQLKYNVAHMANSGAICNLPGSHFDMVRPGLMLYGYAPSKSMNDQFDLKPVLSLTSTVSTTGAIESGDTVGYGRKFTSDGFSNTFTVPVGYADGISRLLSNKMQCLVDGKSFPQIGTISMDRIIFNAGQEVVNTAKKVILLGETENFRIDAWDWAQLIGTIPYEITCAISKRVPRIYV